MNAVAESIPVAYDPLREGYLSDPYPHLAEVRSSNPVQETEPGQWALFRHDDVANLLRDTTQSVSDDRMTPNPEQEAMFEMLINAVYGEEGGYEPSTSLQGMDPPDHTRLRRLMSKAFTNRAVEQFRPAIEGKVGAALDLMEEEGETDLVARLAYPLPFEIISDILGMPASEQPELKAWSESIAKMLDPVMTEDDIMAAVVATREMNRFLDDIVDWKRKNPADDVLTALIRAEEDGQSLTPVELRDQVAILFVAGHETAVNLIGTGIFELLRHGDQARLLRENPELGSTALDEMLRFVSPISFTRRVTTAELAFDGKRIPEGAAIMACLASANRDPEHWGADADRLDLTRQGVRRHLAFGGGAHYCLGAALAKLQGQVALGSFVRRFPNAQVSAEPEWNGRINLRGISKLPMRVTG